MLWYLPVDDVITNISPKREKLRRNHTKYCIPYFNADLRYDKEKVIFLLFKVMGA